MSRRHLNHPWIFSNEVIKAEGITPGDTVLVEERKKIIGTGFYNPHSLIAIRFFSNSEQDFNKDFVHQRIKQAERLRENLGDSYRLIYSESDALPGLIVDRYNDYYVLQINSTGMERQKDLIIDVLIEKYKPQGIYLKSDENLRRLEGLESTDEVVYGKIKELIEIKQDGITFLVDIVKGQKTGFFFDQRENRKRILKYARGEILDCFCYTGGFSLYTAQKGNVLGIDISEGAIEMARKNAILNGFECNFETGDVFKILRKFLNEKKLFDTIILDPPSFTKSKKKKYEALRGYKEINLSAMKLLKEDGVLFTSSCSYHISNEEFIRMLRDACRDAGREFIILGAGQQSRDHPILLNFPESKYLKSYFLKLK